MRFRAMAFWYCMPYMRFSRLRSVSSPESHDPLRLAFPSPHLFPIFPLCYGLDWILFPSLSFLFFSLPAPPAFFLPSLSFSVLYGSLLCPFDQPVTVNQSIMTLIYAKQLHPYNQDVHTCTESEASVLWTDLFGSSSRMVREAAEEGLCLMRQENSC